MTIRHPYQRVRIGKGRRENITISGCVAEADVEPRRKMIRDVADELVAAGRADRVKDMCAQLGAASSQKLVTLIRSTVAELIATESAAPDDVTVQDQGDAWTNGDLHRRFPDHVGKKKSVRDDAIKLRLHVYPVVGHIPICKFTLEDAQRVMRRLPEGRSTATRRHVAQVLYRLFRLAVFPCKILKHSPLPVGFLPKIAGPKAKQYLYPDEDGRLLACPDVELVYRVAYGVLDREGLRTGELIGNPKDGTKAIGWAEFDLDRGMVRLDQNKTDDPRAWALDPFVTRALVAWKEISPKAPFDGVNPNNFARAFRKHLKIADVTRSELTAPTTTARRQIRAHDLRATFITVSLANGKTETWIQDRTGHTSSEMINRYRRIARTFAELRLGTLGPLDAAIPELATRLAQRGVGGQRMGNSDEDRQQKTG